jgi:hypothetical protein
VRELGIFLDRENRRQLLATAVRDGGSDLGRQAAEAARQLELRTPAHDFDLDAVLARLAADPSLPATGLARIRAAVDADPAMSWDELVATLGPPGARGDVWDFVSVAAAVLPAVRQSLTDILPAVTGEGWRRAADGTSALVSGRPM